ncbi:MAG: MBL fold metallo-hydrolase [Myxococcales bacterium]|nr:MBL fold metallo-hydrolase [Myxococcales bacterium]
MMIAAAILLVSLSVLLLVSWHSSSIRRAPFPAPEASWRCWEDILSHPKPITIRTYSTGMMKTSLSAIMNLKHERARGIEDESVEFPVVASIVEHREFGAYLIDAGLDSSYVHDPHGRMRGLLVAAVLGRGHQEPNTHIAAILRREGVEVRGIWLTHLHFDHIAGIWDLPKDITCVVGKGERYVNFAFFMRGDYLAGIDELHELDFAGGVDLPPLGKGIDVLGDGSLWAISSGGHSKGHVMYFLNGVDDKVLVTGDACNTRRQFELGIGPGYFSSDLERAQDVVDRMRSFKALHPDVRLVFGHDLPEPARSPEDAHEC